jgi:lipoprotein-anchoring transpeptidase ErfK/SrfK
MRTPSGKRTQSTSPTRRRAPALVVATLIGAFVGALVAVGLTARSGASIDPAGAAARPPSPPVVDGEWPVTPAPAATQRSSVHPTSFVVADATKPEVPLFASPGEPQGTTMENPTWEGLDVVFLVLERRSGWLRVRVSARPNGMTAWVREGDVTLRRVPNWIKVEVGARRLTVLHGDDALMSTVVAVGKNATPTPTGSFFVDGVVRLDPPHPAYGAGQLSVSGFSPTLESFGGGIGQIALHGTFATSLLGTSASNGCVRVENNALRQIIGMAPTGTPVEIVA